MRRADRPRLWLIGGTGMLSGVVSRLADQASEITLAARRHSSLERAAGLVPPGSTVHMVEGDWSDREDYLTRLERHAERTGKPGGVLAWLHDFDLGPEIARRVCSPDAPSTFLQVCGSRTSPDSLARPELPDAVDYRWVLLGAVAIGSSFRWLSHEEIVEGVWSAWSRRDAISIVGTLDRARD